MSSKPNGSYVGLRNSAALGMDVELFINNIRDGVAEDQNPLLVRIMERFLDEAIDSLLIGACNAVKLQGFARKTVDVTIATVKATCHLLSRRVLRNMRNADVAGLAEHMDDMRFVLIDDDGKPVSYILLPIDETLRRDIEELFLLVSNEKPSHHVGALEDVLFRILDVVVEWLYVRTLGTLTLGPIARRLVEMGYSTVYNGAHALIRRVLPHLSDVQLQRATGFFRDMVLEVHDGALRMPLRNQGNVDRQHATRLAHGE